MKANLRCALESHQTGGRRQRSFAGPRGVLILIAAIGIGLLMVGVVSALTSYQAFHAAAEQVNTGTGTSGTYADTFATDGSYRVIQEEYAGDQARTQADTPSSFTTLATYTNVINLTPYTMPVEGGFIYRIGIYIFEVGTGETQIRLALYEDIEDRPRFLLAQTDPLTATATGWLWFDVEPQLVPGNSRYWLAYQANDGEAELGWKWAPPSEGYRFLSWSWGPFPTLLGTTSGPILRRTCYQVAYTTTRDALDIGYTIPVSTALDAYTLTVRGATSGEPYYVTADGQAVGTISYAPTAQRFFSDDMESGSGGWTASNFTYTVAGSGYYSSPTHVWWTDDVPYGSSASLTSVPITLPFNTHDLELRFWHRMISEHDYDGGWIEYRMQEDGTWSSWFTITDTMFIQGEYNSVLMRVPSGPHAAWSRTHNGVVRIRMPVTTAGHLVQWRWVFECDVLGGEPAEEPDGWWIDDVLVLGKTSDDVELIFSLPPSLASDGQVTVQFQDAITDSDWELLGIDLIEIAGMLNNRPPEVTVTAANGGEYWSGTRTVQWTGSDRNRDVVTYNVYLSTDGGGTWTTSLHQVSYAETEPPTTRSWTGFDTTAFANSENCLIRIQASDGDAGDSDESNAVFAIDNIAPSVTLTAPNGGQILQGGTSYAITWNASDDHFGPLPIALYYSTNGGATFPFTISAATENDGSFTWSVPGINNTHVRVRVVATDLAGHSSYDDSNADFAIDSTAPPILPFSTYLPGVFNAYTP